MSATLTKPHPSIRFAMSPELVRGWSESHSKIYDEMGSAFDNQHELKNLSLVRIFSIHALPTVVSRVIWALY